MAKKKEGCGCCPDCTGEPDCKCCPDCKCGAEATKENPGCGCCPDCTGEPDCNCCPDCCCGDVHGHECCCGDDDGSVLSVTSSILGMILAGTLAVLFGIELLNVEWDFLTSGQNFIAIAAVGALLIIVSVFALKAADLTEGILFLFIGLSALLYFYSDIAVAGVVISLLSLVAAVILIAGRDTMFGISVILFMIGMLFMLLLSGTGENVISGIAFLASGIFFLYIAVSDWLFVETGIDLPIL